MDALFAGHADGGAPGAAVGLYQHGKRIFAKGYGLADIEAGTPITPHTPFHVASVSKQFVAFAIALLAREGKVDLDADVRTYLPYVPDFGGKPITVRHLILHTSGLRDQWSLFELGGQDMDGRLRQQQVLNMVARQRGLNFEPGSEFLYCNTGYTLLGEIVRTVSGQSLRQFTHERMFAPLGMDKTFFFDDVEEVVPGRANSYVREDEKHPWRRSLLNYDNVGATSLFTTVEDLAKWAANFANPTVGDRALIDQISHNGTLDDGTPIRYGFALWRTTIDGRTVVMHTGSDAGFRAVFAYFPDDDFAVAITANTPLDVASKVGEIADIFLPQASADSASAQLPAEQAAPELLAGLSGKWLAPYERALQLHAKDGGLYRGESPERADKLHLRIDGTLDTGKRESWYRLIRDSSGQVTALNHESSNGEALRVYRRAPDYTANAAILEGYTGDYRSAELDITYSVTVDGDHLLVQSLWSPWPIRLSVVAPDRFDADAWALGSIQFQRDQADRVNGLVVNAGRIRHVRLDRVPSP